MSALRIKKGGVSLFFWGGGLSVKKVSTQALPHGHIINIKFISEKDCKRAIGEETEVKTHSDHVLVLFVFLLTILRPNSWTKSQKSFPPCYSQSPLQLCLEISIFSNSHNLLQFLEFSYCTLNRRQGRKPYPLPYGLRNPYRNLKSENSQD